MKKIMGALAKVTLGGALTFFFFYSVVMTIAMVVFIARANDTPEQIQHVQQINKLIDSQGVISGDAFGPGSGPSGRTPCGVSSGQAA